MFFNEKENTNIDHQFNEKKSKKDKTHKKNSKTLIFIGVGLFALIIAIIIVIVIVINNNPAFIELMGAEKIKITVGTEYIEPGYKAYDSKNNDITNKVKVENNVDTLVEGNYEIVYSIKNAKKIRYVTVVEPEKESYIYLKGKTTMYLEIGEKYVDPGYQVYDSVDKDLFDKVKVTGKVDTSKVGTYQITYSVVNSRNVTTKTTRTIIVVEKGQKPNN